MSLTVVLREDLHPPPLQTIKEIWVVMKGRWVETGRTKQRKKKGKPRTGRWRENTKLERLCLERVRKIEQKLDGKMSKIKILFNVVRAVIILYK